MDPAWFIKHESQNDHVCYQDVTNLSHIRNKEEDKKVEGIYIPDF